MSQSVHNVLVLGGGYAGVLAANRLAGRLGACARVTLISDREDLVHRVRLHEALAGRPFQRYPLSRLLSRRVRLVQGRVSRVSAAERCVTISGQGDISYDYLIIALGSRLSFTVPGAREHAGWLATPETAARGAARLAALPAGAPVVVVGGGLTAIEAASEIAEAHPRLAVTMLASSLGAGLSARGLEYLRETLARLGITVREGVLVEQIEEDAVVLEGGERIPAALAVWGAGFTPAGPDIKSDLPCDAHGRLLVEHDLRAPGAPEVFVAGDAAAPAPGMEFLRMGCVSAMPMAAHAADSVARLVRGLAPEPHRFAFMVRCISLGRKRGLIQHVDPYDRPQERILSGRMGALVKELICRFVIGALRIERLWAGAYRWPRAVSSIPSSSASVALLPGE